MKQNSITERTQIREDMPSWLANQFYRKYIEDNDKPIRAEMVSKYIDKYIFPKTLIKEAIQLFELMNECSSTEKINGVPLRDYANAHLQRIKQYKLTLSI